MKLRKAKKRLARRLAAYPGPYPKRDNPGKEGAEGTGHIMHKPGSMTK